MTWLHVPPTIERYTLDRSVLAETERFLRERGERGVEAMVLWLGTVASETSAEVLGVQIPEQVAYRSALGLAVEIRREGLSRLIATLPPGIFVLARVHSHAGAAFHSEIDNQNMVISHQGAISIVVPDFARAPLDLRRCSVNELRHEHGWRELSPEEVERRFTIR